MIESCPKRRMLIGISGLIVLTIVVLIIESNWTAAGPRQQQKHFILENNSTCWQKEKYSIIRECEPCTAFEIKSNHKGICVHTHNKEVLQCKSGEIVSRSCDKVAWLDEKNFYTFECLTIVVGAIATLASYYRQRVLDNKVQLKIQRQLRQAV